MRTNNETNSLPNNMLSTRYIDLTALTACELTMLVLSISVTFNVTFWRLHLSLRNHASNVGQYSCSFYKVVHQQIWGMVAYFRVHLVTVLCLYYFSLSHCTVLLCLCRLMLCISVAYAIVRCPSVRLSVCLGVCHVRVFCRNEKTYSQTSFTHHSSFSTPSLMAIFERGPSLTGASNATGVLKMALSTNISLYLGNDTTPCSKKTKPLDVW